MNYKNISFVFYSIFCVCFAFCQEKTNPYATIEKIPTPSGYERVVVDKDAFGTYLRQLPLKKSRTVYLYNGKQKSNQNAQFAVVDVSVGNKDLQQCADAVIRLRAEYLFQQKKYKSIHFNFSNGFKVDYDMYANGNRLQETKGIFSWKKTTKQDYSHDTFLKYLDLVFVYAGSYSLSKELSFVSPISLIQPGDVFIEGGFPGHAVIVVDVAVSKEGKKIALLAQSYMPAQDIHVLVNSTNSVLSPWFEITAEESDLFTPEWIFKKKNLKRFKQ